MKILVSACLLGTYCRYNGECVMAPGMEKLLAKHTVIPICPEQLGGMATPREPSEIRAGRVYAKSGADVTEYYTRGSREAARIADLTGCEYALLKERSPSCGHGIIHDGSFSGGLCAGDGTAAAKLKEHGLKIFGESEIEKLLELE